MAIIERDVVLQSVDESGRQTIDLPITRLGNVEDAADIKESPVPGDYLAIMDSADGGQMKKVSYSTIVPATRKINQKSLGTDITLTAADVGAATMAQVNSAIQAAVLASWEGAY